jgi:hypothetical protein
VRRWVTPFVWVQGGAGAAAAEVGGDPIDVAPAAMFGFGFELAANQHAVLDVPCHAGTDVVDDDARVYHMSLGLELRWD